MVTLKVPVLLLIVNDPVKEAGLKSAAVAVPDNDQYKVVPLATSVVVTVYDTLEPSLIAVADCDTEYVGGGGGSIPRTTSLVCVCNFNPATT